MIYFKIVFPLRYAQENLINQQYKSNKNVFIFINKDQLKIVIINTLNLKYSLRQKTPNIGHCLYPKYGQFLRYQIAIQINIILEIRHNTIIQIECTANFCYYVNKKKKLS